MAGLGRRTHYRKHLTDSIIYDMPEPGEHERIAKVVATRGGNQFDILLPTTRQDGTSSDANAQEQQQEAQLAILPTKFNKLVWVKRNDFVIVETADDATAFVEEEKGKTAEKEASLAEDTGGIRYIISHILYKDQVRHLQSKGLWPTNDTEFSTDKIGLRASDQEGTTTDEGGANDNTATAEQDDGIVYDMGYMGYEDDEFLVNTNRVAALKVDDSSDSDSS